MVVRSLAASVGKSLVEGVVHCIYDFVEICRVSGVEIVECVPIDYVLNETDAHFSCGVVEFVVAQKRRSGDASVRKPADSIFVNQFLCP